MFPSLLSEHLRSERHDSHVSLVAQLSRNRSEYARAPLSHTPYYWKAWLSIPRPEVKGMAGRKGLLLNPKDPPDASVRIYTGPELIKLFVAGGSGAAYCRLSGAGRWTSRRIELPANWDKLVNEYKNVVPNYALY